MLNLFEKIVRRVCLSCFTAAPGVRPLSGVACPTLVLNVGVRPLPSRRGILGRPPSPFFQILFAESFWIFLPVVVAALRLRALRPAGACRGSPWKACAMGAAPARARAAPSAGPDPCGRPIPPPGSRRPETGWSTSQDGHGLQPSGVSDLRRHRLRGRSGFGL